MRWAKLSTGYAWMDGRDEFRSRGTGTTGPSIRGTSQAACGQHLSHISCLGSRSQILFDLITSFPSLMRDPPLVFVILECLTLLCHACENEDEVTEIWFHQSSSWHSSTTRCTNSVLSAPASLCSSQMTTKYETISLDSCSAMPTRGSKSHSAGLPLSFSPPFRFVSLFSFAALFLHVLRTEISRSYATADWCGRRWVRSFCCRNVC